MLLESQCIKTVSKNAYVFEIHRWLLAFPEISIVKPWPVLRLKHWCLSLALNKFLNKLAKSYTKEDMMCFGDSQKLGYLGRSNKQAPNVSISIY